MLEEILDFGHAPIFEDADSFPCIIVARPRSAPLENGADHGAEVAPPTAADTLEPPTVSVCPVPCDRSTELSLEHYVHEHAYPVPWSRYDAGPWSLESPEVETLMERLRERGAPLAEFVGCKPYRGVLTGLNEAFLIDEATRADLIREDPACAEIIKPYLRGQDIGRWVPERQGLWMIFTRRGIDIDSYPSIRLSYDEYVRHDARAHELIPNEVVGYIIHDEMTPARAWREYLGLTQADAAARADISQAALPQIESGAHQARKATKAKLAAALGITGDKVI